MLNEIKLVLLKPLNEKMDEYKSYRSQLDDLENQLLFDDSEKNYQANLNALKKKYKNPKGEEKTSYEKELHDIMVDYKKKLDLFDFNKEKYDLMKQRLANFNYYDLKQKMEKINLAKDLKELNLQAEEAKKICEENGIEFKFNSEV